MSSTAVAKLVPVDGTDAMPSERDDPTIHHATDPTLVRSIIEARSGYPAHAPDTEGKGDQGLLRVGFRDREEELTELSWEAFFREFEEKDLAVVYADDGSDVVPDRSVALQKRESVAEE